MTMPRAFLAMAMAAQLMVACGPKPESNTPSPAPPPPPATTPAPTEASAPPPEPATPAPAGETSSAGGSKGQIAGNTIQFPEAGVQFTIPAGWEAQSSQDNVTIASPDGNIAILFLFPPEEGFEATADAVGQQVDVILDNVQTAGEPETGEWSGMPWVNVSGTGEFQGQPVEWGVDMVQAAKPVIVLYMGEAEAMKANKEVLDKLDESFQAMEGAVAPPPTEGGGEEPPADE